MRERGCVDGKKFRYIIYLANGLHKAKIKGKISDTVFHTWRNHQGEVVVVAGFCLYYINRWFGFTLYTLKHSEEGWEFPDH